MTDPSFARQLITFTYPHIGNYGVERRGDGVRPRLGARGDHARGDRTPRTRRAPSAAGSTGSADCGVPAITGVDTRALVRHIRSAGAMRGGVFPSGSPRREARELIAAEPPMAGLDLAREVTPGRMTTHGDGDGPRIAAIDTGIKGSIVRNLVERGATVELHPCTAAADDLLAERPRRGLPRQRPGRPGRARATSSTRCASSSASGRCSASASATSCSAAPSAWRPSSCPFGHRGANHPVKDLETGRIEITSQNHGFAVLGPGGARTVDADEPVRWDDRLRRGAAQPREPLRPHRRGPHAARRPRRDGPVPPRGRARAARLAVPLRPLPRPDQEAA